MNEGEQILRRLDATAAITGTAIETVTADAGYACAKVYAGLGSVPINGIPLGGRF